MSVNWILDSTTRAGFQCPSIVGDRLFRVQRALPADAEEVRACLSAAFEPFRGSYTQEAFLDTVPTPASMARRFTTMAIFVAIDDRGHVIGTVSCQPRSPSEGHLRGMAVRSDWQGTRVAGEVLRAAEEELRGQGCTSVTLDTTAPLRRAARFYERHGFRRTGRVTDYFGMPLYEYSKCLKSVLMS